MPRALVLCGGSLGWWCLRGLGLVHGCRRAWQLGNLAACPAAGLGLGLGSPLRSPLWVSKAPRAWAQARRPLRPLGRLA